MAAKKCTLCGGDHYALGWCRNHYARWHRKGSTRLTLTKNKGKKCKVEGCSRTAFTKGECHIHYARWRKYSSYEKKVYRGPANWRWKGGKFKYPDHYTLKKNRLIKLKQTGGKCEECGAAADRVIRKDGSTSNHAVENLMAVCMECFGKNIKLHGNGKYKSKYGPIRDMAKKYSISEATIYQRLRKGLLPDGSGGGRRGRPKKIRLTESPQGGNRA